MVNDDSVTVSLKELFSIEADRRADAAAAVARAAAEEEARQAAAETARRAAIETARAEALREAAREQAATNSALDARIARLKAELDAVQEDRVQIRERFLAPTPAPKRTSGWAIGLATVSLLTAMVAIFVAWPRPYVAPVAENTIAVTAPLNEDITPVVEPVEEEIPAAVEAAEPVAVAVAPEEPAATPVRRIRPPRTHVSRPAQDDLSRALDFGDDDGQILSDDFLNEHR